jgi:hypothetical protein
LEAAHILDAAGDQRGRHELREIENEDLFGRVAHLLGVVDDQRAALQLFKDMGAGDVAQIEGRVLAHQHHIDVFGQIQRLEAPSV